VGKKWTENNKKKTFGQPNDLREAKKKNSSSVPNLNLKKEEAPPVTKRLGGIMQKVNGQRVDCKKPSQKN
jgi:hypothetical protein